MSKMTKKIKIKKLKNFKRENSNVEQISSIPLVAFWHISCCAQCHVFISRSMRSESGNLFSFQLKICFFKKPRIFKEFCDNHQTTLTSLFGCYFRNAELYVLLVSVCTIWLPSVMRTLHTEPK